jgi:glycyl-tRNA synthetase
MEIEIFFDPEKINEIPNFKEIEDYSLKILRLNEEKVCEIKAKELVEKKIVSGKLIAYYLCRVQQFFEKLGIPLNKMRFREIGENERAFYAKETFDFEVKTPFGWIELVANNYRTDYDLKQHSLGSKKKLQVKINGKKLIPHVFEISAGLDRTLFVTLLLAWREETKKEEKRIFLDLPIEIAPFLCGVFPLVKKNGLKELALKIFNDLKTMGFETIFDANASIGRRYARIDELGVPFAITVDYDSLTQKDVTLRERNSTKQKRIKISELPLILWKLSTKQTTFNEL